MKKKMFRPEKDRALEAICRIKSVMAIEPINHSSCTQGMCIPRNELYFIQRGMLQGPPVHPDIYVCNLGREHWCTSNWCEEYPHTSNYTCPISGIEHGHPFSDWVKMDEGRHTKGVTLGQSGLPNSFERMTEGTGMGAFGVLTQLEVKDEEKEEVPAQRQPRYRKSTKEYISIATAIVSTLLYSSVREEINQERIHAVNEARDVKLRHYYRDKSKEIPNLIDVLTIRGNFGPPLCMESLEQDHERLYQYVNIIMHVWRVVVTSPYGKENPNVSFKQVALATLYQMQQGYNVEGVLLLPADPYLFNLPPVKDLTRFNDYNQRSVTAGRKVIFAAYTTMLQTQPLDTMVYRG
jgi:hypothetical protein